MIFPTRCEICRCRGYGVDERTRTHWVCYFRKLKGTPIVPLRNPKFQNTKKKRNERFAAGCRAIFELERGHR